MSWNDNATTPDALCPVTRGWEPSNVASEKLMNESMATSCQPDVPGCNFRDRVQFQGASGGMCPEIQPVTVPKDGGTVTIDEFNRVTAMQDAAHRQFLFGYDNKTGDLNKLTNESGTWTRQKHHGHYTDEWKNERHDKWKGDVTVNPDGYSFTRDNQRTTYKADGSVTQSYLSNGQPFYTDTMLASGEHKVNDGRLPAPPTRADNTANSGTDGRKDSHAKEGVQPSDANGVEVKTTPDGTVVTDRKAMKETTYFDAAREHVKSVHDLKNNSVLTYDQQGHLSSMKDVRGTVTSFKDYDRQGNPHTVENGRGLWHKIGDDTWSLDKPASNLPARDGSVHNLLHFNLSVGKDGFSMIDRTGHRMSYSADGTIIDEYKGIKVITDAQNKKTRQFADGTAFEGDAVKGSLQFTVKKGDTKSGHLNIPGSEFEVVQGRTGDVHARIQARANAPIAAMQDGLVVYTYNHDAKVAGNNQMRSSSAIGLSQADMETINQYRKSNPDKDLVVMQCYDPVSRGVRYEIYAGLNLANAAPGYRVKAGEVLGTSGDNGFVFGARKGRVSGKSVPLTF